MIPIKFRGTDMNGNYVFGFLTKKKIRSSGKLSWAIATGNCSLAETIPIDDDFSIVIGEDDTGNVICAGDVTAFTDNGEPLSAELYVALVDKYGHHYYAPCEYHWLFGSNNEYKPSIRYPK